MCDCMSLFCITVLLCYVTFNHFLFLSIFAYMLVLFYTLFSRFQVSLVCVYVVECAYFVHVCLCIMLHTVCISITMVNIYIPNHCITYTAVPSLYNSMLQIIVTGKGLYKKTRKSSEINGRRVAICFQSSFTSAMMLYFHPSRMLYFHPLFVCPFVRRILQKITNGCSWNILWRSTMDLGPAIHYVLMLSRPYLDDSMVEDVLYQLLSSYVLLYQVFTVKLMYCVA